MNAATHISDLLDDRPVRVIEPGLLSVLPADAPGQRYDSRARAYDRIIGSRLYNRLFWGSSPEQYRSFARRAVGSSASGWLLDAGCGTLLLTADAYAAAPHRPVVAMDQSLGMLHRAKERLGGTVGAHPEHVVFLQADLLDLPFQAECFQTVLSMGMLHLFDTLDPLLSAFRRCLEPGGQLFLSGLVENGRFGDHYMRFLHRAGELAAPRASSELESILRQALATAATYDVIGNMAYATSRA